MPRGFPVKSPPPARTRPRGTEKTPAPRPAAPLLVLPEAAEEGDDAVLAGRRSILLTAQREALMTLGRSLDPMISCLERFFVEVRDQIGELETAVTEDSRARLQGRVGRLREALEWSQAVLDDLVLVAGRAEQGTQRLEVRAMIEDLAGPVEEAHPGVRVSLVPASHRGTCWARATTVHELLQLAMHLVARRIGGEGALAIEVGEEHGAVRCRILGTGEVVEVEDAQAVARLRELVVDLDGRVTPDALGPDGAGLVLSIPTRRLE